MFSNNALYTSVDMCHQISYRIPKLRHTTMEHPVTPPASPDAALPPAKNEAPQSSADQAQSSAPRTDEEAFHLNVDLFAYEERYGKRPIFTRELLQKIKADTVSLSLDMRKDWKDRSCRFIKHTSVSGECNIWDDLFHEPEEDYLFVQYLSRVQLHPDFQRHCWGFTDANNRLRVYNQDLAEKQKAWISAPYVLDMFERYNSFDHMNNERMRFYLKQLQHTASLWKKSKSRLQLDRAMVAMASRFSLITKIVCFGLGAISMHPGFYHSGLQHFTVFTIATILEAVYKQPVEIILQDPCYQPKDIQSLQKLWGRSLTSATDPDALLAIDSSSIVITAGLPVSAPIVQIVADLGIDDPKRQPAAIFCDRMKLDPSKRMYSLTDRSSPSVARFLTQGYTSQGFENHELEPELWDDVYQRDPQNDRVYWLGSMQLYTRR